MITYKNKIASMANKIKQTLELITPYLTCNTISQHCQNSFAKLMVSDNTIILKMLRIYIFNCLLYR